MEIAIQYIISCDGNRSGINMEEKEIRVNWSELD